MPVAPPLPNGFTAIQPITDEEFGRFQRLIFDIAGISLCPAKKLMVASRLQRRLAHYGFSRYGDYYHLVTGESHPHERQILVDLLTTNETYFFREPAHFDFLRDEILSQPIDAPFRVWSAASSSGEEVYSLAMVLADSLGERQWEVMGSDVSQRVLYQAQRGHYPMERNEGICTDHLKKYCLKGIGPQANTFLIDKRLKARVSFRQINLKQPLSNIGRFDVIFLRNVLIYFNQETKRQIVNRVIGQLNRGGHLFISHTESLHGMAPELELVKPSMFRKR